MSLANQHLEVAMVVSLSVDNSLIAFHYLVDFMPAAGEKPYKCNQCEKAFNQKGALQIHLMKHTGDRPYQCEFCPSKFSQRGNLRAHIQVRA